MKGFELCGLCARVQLGLKPLAGIKPLDALAWLPYLESWNIDSFLYDVGLTYDHLPVSMQP